MSKLRGHEKDYKIKDRSDFDQLIEYLKSSCQDPDTGETISVWELACRQWNKLNPRYKISDDDIEAGMPDYDFNTILNYNEKEN